MSSSASIEAFCRQAERSGVAGSAVVNYRQTLVAAERRLGPLVEVGPAEWARYLAVMDARVARTTLLVRIRVLRRFLSWAGVEIPEAMTAYGVEGQPVPRAWRDALEEWSLHQRAAAMAPGTVRTRLEHMGNLARNGGIPDPARVTGADLVRWVGTHDWAPETAYSVRTTFRAFFSWAHETGLTETNPALALPRVRRPEADARPLSIDALRAALVRARADGDVRLELMLVLACGYGLRRAELSAVNSADVHVSLDGHGETVHLLVIHGKGRKDRRVPIDADLAARITSAGGFLFPGRYGPGHISPNWAGRILSRALGDAGTVHMGRHLFGTLAYQETGDLLTLQRILGHASPMTTKRYVQLDPDRASEMTEAVAERLRLDPGRTGRGRDKVVPLRPPESIA